MWLLVGLVAAIACLTKLTVLFFGMALLLALLVTPQRCHLRTPWPWLAGGIAFLGLLPYLIWNAANGWPTLEFWLHYGGTRTGPAAFVSAQIGQLNPVAVPLAGAGLIFYFRRTGVRYRLLGWTFAFAFVVLILLGTKPYFVAPAYPILFAAGAVLLERFRQRWQLAWMGPAYVAFLAGGGLLLAPGVMPILPPATVVQAYRTFHGSLAMEWGDEAGNGRRTGNRGATLEVPCSDCLGQPVPGPGKHQPLRN